MNASERARFDVLKCVGDYGTLYAADFIVPVLPPAAVTSVQTKATGHFDALNSPATGLIARIDANATAQQAGAGDFHGGTTSKSVLRHALLLDLRAINRTAAAIAEEDNTPGLTDSFRMPYGVDDVMLCARARAMAQAATPLLAKFVDLGFDDTFLDDLETRVADFESADSDQNEGEETRSGATANFGSLLREALAKVKSLDAIIHNFHAAHPAKLGAWRTASHVEREEVQPYSSKGLATPPSQKLRITRRPFIYDKAN